MAQTPSELTAETVRVELARRRISGRKMARALGWSYTTTARRLSGEYPFDIDELAAVAAFLGIPTAALLPADLAA
ncbi:MAG TPA: helix-turn-helix domain-containing protein [Solirubrobacteraceae bacterium]|nr:helix-turn-helix domain-containing protein [Solirubrobacteraceae bacterium]